MKDYYELVTKLNSKKGHYRPLKRHWLLIQGLKVLLSLPLISHLSRRSFVLVTFYLELQRAHQRLEAMLTMIEQILTSNYYLDAKRANYWWYIMKMAVGILQERQMLELIVNPSLENRLILLGFDHYNPLQQANHETVAYCFVAYSLWLFERAKVSEATDFAKIAANCNPQWGYPDYLVGWYSLFIDGADSLEYFQKAVAKNWSFLHRINNDRMCQRHKTLIKQLNHNLLVKKIS